MPPNFWRFFKNFLWTTGIEEMSGNLSASGSMITNQPTPQTIVYSELVDVSLNNNNINLVDVDYGHRLYVECSAATMNSCFTWTRGSGDKVPTAVIDAAGLAAVVDELSGYIAQWGFSDNDNFQNLDYSSNSLVEKVRTMSANDLVVAYILFKLYGTSYYDLSGTTFNPEDLKAMLSTQTFLQAISDSLTNAPSYSLNSMLNELLVSDPMRFFDASGNQIEGLFEVVDGVSGSGNFMLAPGDIIEIRVRMAFTSTIQRTSLDSGNGNDKIVPDDKFMVRLQINVV